MPVYTRERERGGREGGGREGGREEGGREGGKEGGRCAKRERKERCL